MAEHITLGKQGEEIALQYLKDKGYTILERNWRNSHKEIDIVAKDGDTLVIVEVKTRHTSTFGEPYEAVTQVKERLLVSAANSYICKFNMDCDTRFDIVSIILPQKGEPIIEHIEDAFEPC